MQVLEVNLLFAQGDPKVVIADGCVQVGHENSFIRRTKNSIPLSRWDSGVTLRTSFPVRMG
jgi:hypothetical protein